MNANDVTFIDLLTFASAALALLAAGTLLVRGRRPRSPQQRYLIAALSALAIETALGAPWSIRVAYHLDPIPHLTRVVVAELAMIGSFGLVAVALYSSLAGSAARRCTLWHLVGLVACCVAAPACLFGGHVAASPTRAIAATGVAVLFVLIRVIYTTSTTVVFVMASFRAARIPETPAHVRLGFQLGQAAGAVAILHGTWTVAINLGLVHGAVNQTLTATYLAAALGLLAAGATVRFWSTYLHAARLALVAWSIRRFWSDLAGLNTVGGVELRPVVSSTATERAAERLAMYVSSLGDLHRVARAYAHPDLREWIDDLTSSWGLTRDAQAIVLAAVEFAVAVDAVAHDLPALSGHHDGELLDRRAHGRRATDSPAVAESVMDVLAEARRLRAVRVAYLHSPVVAELRQRASVSPVTTADSVGAATPAARRDL